MWKENDVGIRKADCDDEDEYGATSINANGFGADRRQPENRSLYYGLPKRLYGITQYLDAEEELMQLPYSEKLNIAALSRLFDNKSECYKLFWFQAILGKVCEGASDII